MEVPQQIVDVFELRVGFESDMLIDMYFYAGGTKGEQAASAAAEVSK